MEKFCRKTFLDSTYFGLRSTQRVSPYLPDLVMDWTSCFLVQSDKVAIVPHLLLAPKGTVVKSQQITKFAHRPSPIQEGASQGSEQNRKYQAFLGLWKTNGLTRKSSFPARSLGSWPVKMVSSAR